MNNLLWFMIGVVISLCIKINSILEKRKKELTMEKKTLDITEIKGAKENISDIKVYGDGDTFALLCKASSDKQGWMKSTKVMNVVGGCVVQVSTQQRNEDGSYAVAEALTYVPGMHLDKCEGRPEAIRRLVPIV